MHTTYKNIIGLEDVEKKRGASTFQSEHQQVKLEMEEMVPVPRREKEPLQIIIRERKRKQRKDNLF